MSAITVEEFVNKVSYKVDVESLKQVLRVTDKLYAHLGKALTGVSSRMDVSWRTSMANMAKASSESARAIAADGHKASAAWKLRTPGAATPQGGKEGRGMGLLAMAGRLVAGYAAYSVGKFAVTSAADLERMTAQFEVMLQSADKAKTMVGDIQKLAASTPLTSMGITEGVKTLLQFGVAGDQAINTVRMLGDVAGGDQERLSRLALAYGQTVSAGKLMGQDLLQYINIGFNPLKIMEENLDKFGLKAGTTQGELRDMMSKGKISADMVTKAFQMATSQGGMFYNNMEKQSKTLGGLYSSLVDNVQIALVKAMQPIIPLLKTFIDWLGQLDWTPVVNGVTAVVEGVKLFGRTLVDAGIFESLELIKIAIAELFGDNGPIDWSTAIRAAANVVADAFWWISQIIAATVATIQALKDNLWAVIPIAMSFGAEIGAAMLAALGPIGAIVAALGVVYYAYQRINDAREQGAREEKYHAAMVEEAAASSEYATYKQERAKLVAQNRMYDQMGNPNDAGRARRNATIAKFDEMISASAGRRDAANAKLVAASGIMPTTAATTDPFGALLQQQINASKKVSITQNNNIQMPVTVDDKGQTQLTPGAVNSLVDTKLRSVLNVKFLGVLAQGI